jgi:hypothetical protein
MSQRKHFWLRLIGLAVILVLEFGPRLWQGAQFPTAGHPVATAANVAR